MKTKFLATFAAFLGTAQFLFAATNDLTGLVQKGLFEEEANHNLPAAEQAYQTAIENYDKDRHLAATAIFRLGECYRKQGDTKAAAAQYQRVLREFSDQTELVKLCEGYVGKPAGTIASETPDGSTQPSAATAKSTDPEELEIREINQMLHDSPDLINRPPGGTMLIESVKRGWTNAVKLLLDHGVNIDLTTADGVPGAVPLTDSVETDKLPVIELLLSRGAKVDGLDRSGYPPPLYLAAQQGLMRAAEILLAHGANVNLKSHTTGMVPLAIAIEHNFPDMARLLLAKGADVDATNSTGQTPLGLAVASGRADLVQLLISNKANVDLAASNGETPLIAAVKSGNIEIAKLLLDAGARTESQPVSALLAAVQSDKPEMVEFLLAHHADPNSRSGVQGGVQAGFTPLIEIGAFAPAHGTNMAAMLLEHGADPSLLDFNRGMSVLHWAVVSHDVDLVRFLLDHRCNVNLPDKNGNPPIAHVNENRPDPRNSLMVQLAASYQAVKTLLLSAGANEDYKRFPGIFITQAGSGSIGHEVFFGGSNSFNHYTLLDLIDSAYGEDGAGAVPFPDLHHITINRLKGNGKSEDLDIDLDAIAQSGDCSKDVPLQWGDVVEVAQTDHSLHTRWSGFPVQVRSFLVQCLNRSVGLIIKGNTNKLDLVTPLDHLYSYGNGNFATVRHDAPAVANSHPFDIRAVVQKSNLLLLSSDLSRVKVTRRDPTSPDHPLVMEFDLTKPKVDKTDLLLRDGDVIEIPERGANTAKE